MTHIAATRPRPRGFAPWRPRAESIVLLEQVRQVLAEYRDHLPLTARQVFYRLVATRNYPKTETGYERLCQLLNRARRAGLVPFEAIRDDGTTRLEPVAYADEDDFLSAVRADAASFRLDRQVGQPTRLWLMCEAAGMAPMLARVAERYGVPVLSSGGFDSLTAKYDLACEITDALRHHERAEVLHIGDYDPSGTHAFQSLAEDVGEMVEVMAARRPTFTRLAVLPEQAALWNLPTAPPKATDRRRFEGETTQAEALPPNVLAEIIEEAIQARQRGWLRREIEWREGEIRARLLERLGGLP